MTGPQGAAGASGPSGTTGTKKGEATQLPSVDELYHQAKKAGVADAWPSQVRMKPKPYAQMKAGERALEVGILLANLAIVSSDETKPVSLSVLEDAQAAIDALNPPADVRRLVEGLVAKAKSGLKGKELRGEIDQVVARAVPLMQADPASKATAELVVTGAYLHSLGLVSSSLTGVTDPTKLSILYHAPDETQRIAAMQALPEDIKSEKRVAEATEALQKIKDPISHKAPTPDDAKAVAAALKTFT
jgi:hypothetical protein